MKYSIYFPLWSLVHFTHCLLHPLPPCSNNAELPQVLSSHHRKPHILDDRLIGLPLLVLIFTTLTAIIPDTMNIIPRLGRFLLRLRLIMAPISARRPPTFNLCPLLSRINISLPCQKFFCCKFVFKEIF